MRSLGVLQLKLCFPEGQKCVALIGKDFSTGLWVIRNSICALNSTEGENSATLWLLSHAAGRLTGTPVLRNSCAQESLFHNPCAPESLCSSIPVLQNPYVPESLFHNPCAPKSLCSRIPVVQNLCPASSLYSRISVLQNPCTPAFLYSTIPVLQNPCAPKSLCSRTLMLQNPHDAESLRSTILMLHHPCIPESLCSTIPVLQAGMQLNSSTKPPSLGAQNCCRRSPQGSGGDEEVGSDFVQGGTSTGAGV